MAPRPRHQRLRVYQNNRLVGFLLKRPNGAIEFHYDDSWLSLPCATPVSLSLPLREDAFRGEPVVAVFENLLPDSIGIRQRIAGQVGASGTDAYSLLLQIGRDCVGALQFIPDNDTVDMPDSSMIDGHPLSEEEIENILNNLAPVPLGLDRDSDFRISVAGAQEKTALLFHQEQWLRPIGTTPTTHIFKTQIGTLPNGLNLSDSVENEYYALALMDAFGLPVTKAEIKTFGTTKSLVIQRFDRAWTEDGRLLRLPQEDCCQALSVPPSHKYQNEGGPGIADILDLLKASDTPEEDQKAFLKAQILFWLMGATDGHAKNFSIFLGAGGRFRLTPFYDVLTAQPYCDAGQIALQKMKLAMFVGDSRHYRINDIQGRHFIQTVHRAGLSERIAKDALEAIADMAENAKRTLENRLPPDFPERIHASVWKGLYARLNGSSNGITT